MVVAYVSIFLSQYPEISLSKQDVIYIWFLEVLFFVNCVKNRTQFFIILVLFFLAMFKMSFFGARTWVSRGFGFTKWGIAGPSGFFANSGEFSLLMAMVAVLAIGFLIGTGKYKTWYALLPITATMTVMGASSRGGQLALIAGLLYLALRYKKISLKYIIVFSTVGYLAFNLMPEEQLERFRGIGVDNTSQSRLDYWAGGWDMMKDYPAFGVGYYGFPEHYSRNYKIVDPDSFLSNRMEVAHNSFIEVGSTMGFIGLACYLGLLGYVIHCSRYIQRRVNVKQCNKDWLKDFSIGMQSAVVVYVVGSSFMSVAFYPYIYLLLMFAALLKKCWNNAAIDNKRSKSIGVRHVV